MIATNHLDANLEFLAEDPELLLAIVFGSAAKGNARSDSDIDIAIYPRSPLNPKRRQNVADALAMTTGRAVDLIDLSTTADGALVRQILSTGIVLFNKDPGLLGILSERMLDWQEDFEPQLNQLLQTRLNRFTSSLHGS
jgi:uncharacterized protein